MLFQQSEVFGETMGYIMAVLASRRRKHNGLLQGCPRCQMVEDHTQECALGKIIQNYERKLRDLPDCYFLKEVKNA